MTSQWVSTTVVWRRSTSAPIACTRRHGRALCFHATQLDLLVTSSTPSKMSSIDVFIPADLLWLLIGISIHSHLLRDKPSFSTMRHIWQQRRRGRKMAVRMEASKNCTWKIVWRNYVFLGVDLLLIVVAGLLLKRRSWIRTRGTVRSVPSIKTESCDSHYITYLTFSSFTLSDSIWMQGCMSRRACVILYNTLQVPRKNSIQGAVSSIWTKYESISGWSNWWGVPDTSRWQRCSVLYVIYNHVC